MTTPEITAEEFDIDPDDEPVNGGEGRDDRRFMVRLLAEYRDLVAEQAEANAWQTALHAEYMEARQKRDGRCDEIEAAVQDLAPQFRVGKSEHVDIPGYARIAFRITPAYLRIADPDAFVAWAKAAEQRELIKTKTIESVDTAAAKEVAGTALAETGVLLPGIESIAAETRMSIVLKA